MRRRIAMLLTALVGALGLVVLGPARPGSAWVACAGVGTMDIFGGGLLNLVTFNTPSKNPTSAAFDVLIGDLTTSNPTYGIAFSWVVGTCVHARTSPPLVDTSKNITPATGIIKGYCDLATGRGTLANGDLFAFVSVGSKVVFTGHFVGLVSGFIPDTLSGQTCSHSGTKGSLQSAGALRFLLGWTVLVLLNCDPATLQTTVPLTPSDHESLVPLVTTQVPLPLVGIKVNLGLHYFWNGVCVGSPAL